MYVHQKRAYKYNASRLEIHKCIEASETLAGKWKDEDNFSLKGRGPFSLFNLDGNIDELESNSKLKIAISTDYKYFLVYTLPLALTVYGLLRFLDHSGKSLYLILAGISLCIFFFLITSSRIDALKKNFKETLNML